MFTAAVGDDVIFICGVFALLTVELRSRLLRLFSDRVGEGCAYSARRYELRSYVNTIARASFRYSLYDVSVVGHGVFLDRVAFCAIERIFYRFFTVPCHIRRRYAILARATDRVMRARMDLGITDRGVQYICRVNETSQVVARARIEADRATKFLEIMERVDLTVFVYVIASSLS